MEWSSQDDDYMKKFTDFQNYINTEKFLSKCRESVNKEFSGQVNSRCNVCGDQEFGIHYGVNSCESCRIFFK